jgi:hypothetical protein
MKFRIFMLTRNEQRVVVLALLVLLAAAFVRYWHNVQTFPPNKANDSPAMATPLPIDDEPGSDDNASDDSKSHQVPSPQSSP